EILGEHSGAKTGLEAIPKCSVHHFDKLLSHNQPLTLLRLIVSAFVVTVAPKVGERGQWHYRNAPGARSQRALASCLRAQTGYANAASSRPASISSAVRNTQDELPQPVVAGLRLEALAPVQRHGEVAQREVRLDNRIGPVACKSTCDVARHHDRQVGGAHDAG